MCELRTGRVVLMTLLGVVLVGAPGAAQPPDRSTPPELGPPPALQLPQIERFELVNGLEVVLLEKHEVPVVQLSAVIRAGSVDDPGLQPGLAQIVAEMLDEGAGDLGALELADAIEYLGAELETWSDHHAMGVDLFTPLTQLDTALPLFAAVVRDPAFDGAELERQRLQYLTGLLQDRDEPRAIAAVQFDRTLFGEEHPYGRAMTAESLRSISRQDLTAFHGRHFRPGNTTLIVVGDVEADATRPKLEAAFGSWDGEHVESTQVPPTSQVTGRRVLLVDKPGAAQSEIRIGRIAPPRDTEDYFAILVMNTVLGGSFTSRLNSNLREDKGYSYGARSSFEFRPAPGPFVATSAVQTDVTDKALVEFMKELTAIGEISEDELERARNYVALRFPQRFQTVGRIASQLTEMVVHDLPDDYFNHYVDRVLAVTMADVARVAETYIDPENLAIVVVGDRSAVEAGVRALDLGPRELLTVEDVLGPAPEMLGE